MSDILIEYGEVVGYAVIFLFALGGLGIVQMFRRRGDVKKARLAVRLVSHSLAEPRVGPVAVTGTWHEEKGDRWLQCWGQRVTLDGPVEVVRGTSARWKGGTRTYAVSDGDTVITIGVMSKLGDGSWKQVASPGEAGVQLYASHPNPAPPPLFPWRAPLILLIWGGIWFGVFYAVGMQLIDVPPRPADAACSQEDLMRFGAASAVPLLRDEVLARYKVEVERCRKP